MIGEARRYILRCVYSQICFQLDLRTCFKHKFNSPNTYPTPNVSWTH